MRPAYIGLRRRDQTPGQHFHASNPIVLGRKFCALCGRWRHVCDFRPKYGRPYAYCQGCERRRLKEHFHSMTDEQRERRNEYARIRWDAKARAAGKKKRNRNSVNSVVDHIEQRFLEVGPLLRLLDDRLDEIPGIAHMSGIDEREIYRLRVESVYVRIDVADKLCVAMDVPLELVYDGARTRDRYEVSID